MAADEWVVLVEYQAHMLGALVDPDVMDLRFLQQELNQQGIDAAFDPFPPGEGDAVFTASLQQPIRLMVRATDLDRARDVARDLFPQGTHPAADDRG